MTEFALIPGESFNGAAARWANMAGLERMMDITAHAGVVYAHCQYAPQATYEKIAAMAAAMGVDPSDLVARATPRIDADGTSRYDRHLFHGVSLPSYLIEKRKRRYAPAGLAMSLADTNIGAAFDRAIWHIRAFPFCAENWQTLRDTCPVCDEHPSWKHTLGIDRCEHCMADLTKADADSVPEGLRPALADAVGLVDHHAERRAASLAMLPASISQAGPSIALDMLVNLMPVIDPLLPTNPVLMLSAPALQITHAVAASWKVMVAWPAGMGALASARIANRNSRHSDGNGGRTLRFLSPKRNKGIPVELQKIIAEWRADIDVDGPKAPAIRKNTRSITDAARFTRMGSQDLANLRRRDTFPTVFALEHGRPEPRLPVEVFKTMAELAEVRMSLEGARLAVGVPCQGIEQLVAMRLLDQEKHPIVTARYEAMRIDSSSVVRLESQVVAGARGDPDVCTLPLHAAMKAVGGRLKPWGPAIQMLLDENSAPQNRPSYVVAPGHGPLSRRVLVDPGDISRLHGLDFDGRDPGWQQIQYSETMSKIDASEILNLGFSRSTLLLSSFRTAIGTHDKVVPVVAVLELARTHISTSELGARRGVSPKRAWSDATKAGVKNLGPGGFCREQGERHLLAIAGDDVGPGIGPG